MNDAFGTAHRAHASTVGITHFVKESAAGLLMEKELQYLGKALEHPEKPFVAILGGAKVERQNRRDPEPDGQSGRADHRRRHGLHLPQGARRHVGKSLLEDDKIDLARDLLQQAKARKVKFLLPVDHVVADRSRSRRRGQIQIGEGEPIPADMMALDIGPRPSKLSPRKSPAPAPSSGTAPWESSRSAVRPGHLQDRAGGGRKCRSHLYRWRRRFT